MKTLCDKIEEKIKVKSVFSYANVLSNNNPCFQYNVAITNFLVSHTCGIKFNHIIGQSTVPMYSYAKISKTWLTYMEK